MMARKRIRLTDEIRQAIERSGLSRYRICLSIGLDKSAMSRFMNDPAAGMGCEMLNKLADLLDLHVTTGRKPKAQAKGRGKAKG